jgi:diguanylate cyclase (GGDEF)-like protein
VNTPAPGVTGRVVSRDTVTREYLEQCEGEAIHLIGTVQPHGFVAVLDGASGQLVQLSAGWPRFFDTPFDARELLKRPLDALFQSEGRDLQALIDALTAVVPTRIDIEPQAFDLPAAPGSNPVRVSPIAATHECMAHRSGSWVVLEFTPQPPSHDRHEQDSRLFARLQLAMGRLRSHGTLPGFYRDCVDELRALSGYDRVMLYRFLPDWSGEVMSESTASGVPVKFKGLRFPASDIPPQARQLYERHTLRVLADIEAEPDRLWPSHLPNGEPLDQSHSHLRSMSLAHVAYLRNMGVRATLTISLMLDGRLWGMLACHHHEPRNPPHHLREVMRSVCDVIAGVVAMRIADLSQIDAANRRTELGAFMGELNRRLVAAPDLAGTLNNQGVALLQAFDSACWGLRLPGFDYVFPPLGGPAADQNAATTQLLNEIEARFAPTDGQPIRQTLDLLSPSHQPLSALGGVAGLLVKRLPAREQAWVFFGRHEQVEEVNWAGDPGELVAVQETDRVRLEPRRSFGVWCQTVRGLATRWNAEEVQGARDLAQTVLEAWRVRVNLDLQKQLDWRANHDPLTGLYNRSFLDAELTRRLQSGQGHVVVFMMDLDHFKRVNDTFGHAAGDQLLRQFGDRLKALTRADDMVVRLGGDEFVLITHVAHGEIAEIEGIGQRILRALAHPFDVAQRPLSMGSSVGIALSPEHGTAAGDLLKNADLALYAAKARGRGCFVFFEQGLQQAASASFDIEQRLRPAIGAGQLRLHYQTKVDLASGQALGLEALVRWQHPQEGLITPDRFIAVAERSDLIQQLGRWVLDEACRQMAAWREAGYPLWPVAVNVSFRQVQSGDLVADIQAALSRHRLPPESLHIELTETVLMQDPEQTRHVLADVSALGVQVALDDFGTVYSSLAHLQQMPLNTLKIDRSFVTRLHESAESRVVVQGIIGLARGLHLGTVAEGVELPAQREWLLDLGCEVAQGYLFSRPVPADDVPAVVRNSSTSLARTGAMPR